MSKKVTISEARQIALDVFKKTEEVLTDFMSEKSYLEKLQDRLIPGQEPIEIGQDGNGAYYILYQGIDYVGNSLEEIIENL